MRKILFLVSRPGLGHIRCAEAIREALCRSGSDVTTDMLDIHDLIDGRVSAAIIDGYLRMTDEQPELYQRLYDLDRDLYRQLSGAIPADRAIAEFLTAQQQRWFPEFAAREWLAHPRRNFDRALINTLVNGVRQSHSTPLNRVLMQGLMLLIYRVLARRLREAVRQYAPDVLVATQMYPNALLTPTRLAGQLPQPLIGVITDFGVHGVWVRDTTDYYCVANPGAAHELQARGVPREKILVTGIPLMPSFADPPGQEEARSRLGLPRRPVVLVTGGEYGFGTREAVRRLIQEADGPTVLVTTARNGHSARDFETLGRANPTRLKVCSWTNDMPWLMRAADVVVGKPGGLTISESLACGRPFIATCCLGGQEAHNLRFLEGQGVGLRVEPERLPDFLKSLFAEPGKLRRWQGNAAGAGYRQGANAVAELVRRRSADDQNVWNRTHADSG
jgi:processive 1,2-diacylglycerol beta-glucosyltransferase